MIEYSLLMVALQLLIHVVYAHTYIHPYIPTTHHTLRREGGGPHGKSNRASRLVAPMSTQSRDEAN